MVAAGGGLAVEVVVCNVVLLIGILFSWFLGFGVVFMCFNGFIGSMVRSFYMF